MSLHEGVAMTAHDHNVFFLVVSMRNRSDKGGGTPAITTLWRAEPHLHRKDRCIPDPTPTPRKVPRRQILG